LQADRDGVAGPVGIRVVVGELEPGDDQQPEGRECSFTLLLDLVEIAGEALLAHAGASVACGPRIVVTEDVVGDAEHVEARSSVEIDQLGERQLAVAPRRVGVELAQQCRPPHAHLPKCAGSSR
jgi:hypothetical protein